MKVVKGVTHSKRVTGSSSPEPRKPSSHASSSLWQFSRNSQVALREWETDARGHVSRILYPLILTRVSDDHFSGSLLAQALERSTRRPMAGSTPTFLFDLSPGGVCPASFVTKTAVRSYRTVSPLPRKRGGLFSVALSLTLRSVAVNNHPDPRSPDFPP